MIAVIYVDGVGNFMLYYYLSANWRVNLACVCTTVCVHVCLLIYVVCTLTSIGCVCMDGKLDYLPYKVHLKEVYSFIIKYSM